MSEPEDEATETQMINGLSDQERAYCYCDWSGAVCPPRRNRYNSSGSRGRRAN
jgi:hypothetical protein